MAMIPPSTDDKRTKKKITKRQMKEMKGILFYVTIGFLVHKDLWLLIENNYKVYEGF